MKTYTTMYQNEIRAIELLIRNQKDEPFYPDTVLAKVVDMDGNIIISETGTLIIDNTASFLINEDVTSNIGNYEVIWRITKNVSGNEHVYYHKTNLNVEEL
jgi:hypothetical protein